MRVWDQVCSKGLRVGALKTNSGGRVGPRFFPAFSCPMITLKSDVDVQGIILSGLGQTRTPPRASPRASSASGSGQHSGSHPRGILKSSPEQTPVDPEREDDTTATGVKGRGRGRGRSRGRGRGRGKTSGEDDQTETGDPGLESVVPDVSCIFCLFQMDGSNFNSPVMH